MTQTYSPKASEITRGWHLLDAQGQVLGRLATRAAIFLMGKHKVGFASHLDVGDHVVIVNSEKITATGQKETQKIYTRHTGYPGGLRQTVLGRLRSENPRQILIHAVSGMLPDNKLKSKFLQHLHVVTGPDNPYARYFK